MNGLDGKISVVTGGSAGIGLATVRRLLNEGCRVAAIDLTEPEPDVRTSLGEGFHFHRTDISDDQRLGETAAQIEGDLGPVSLLVSNAAQFIFRGADATVEEFEQILRVNVVAASRVVHHFLPQLRRHSGASIVVLSSVSGFVGQEQFATYTATKFALRGLVKSWAADFAADGIRVNAVCPACVETEAFRKAVLEAGLTLEQARSDYGKCHLMNRIADPSEVASVIAFALSDEASFMTGSDLVVDGGYLASVEKNNVTKSQ